MIKTTIFLLTAAVASAQNYASFTTGSTINPVSRMSWLRNQGFNGQNVFGDSAMTVYLPMADCRSGPFNDLSNHGVVATISGMYQNNSQRGKIGSCAAYFNKSVPNAYLVTPTPTVTVPWTISAWVLPNYPTCSGQFPRVLETLYSSALYLGGDNACKYTSTVGGTFSTSSGTLTTASWPNGPWVMLTQTYDGTTMSLYINGSLQNAKSASSPGTQTIAMAIGYCSSAGSGGCSGSQGAWDGNIQAVRVLSRVMAAGEVSAIYNAENH